MSFEDIKPLITKNINKGHAAGQQGAVKLSKKNQHQNRSFLVKTHKDIDVGHLPSLNYWVSKTKLLTVDLSTSVTKTDLKALCLVLDFQRLQSAHLDSEIARHYLFPT